VLDLPSFGSFFFDAALLIIAAAGWKRVWDLEREINAQSSTWKATAEALKEELQNKQRGGQTTC
jgi:hypothetical protein